MPPKSKRRRQSAEAAFKGRQKLQDAYSQPQPSQAQASESHAPPQADANITPSDEHESVHTPGEAAVQTPTLPMSEPGPSSGVEEAGDRESIDILEEFVQDWVTTLDRDDKKSLAMLLCFIFVNEFSFTETRAAETAGKIINKNDKTIRRWRTDLIANNGTFSDSKQGRYQRSGVLWADEEMSKQASEYVRMNASVKGKPNHTVPEFCKWVNKSLLPNSTIAPGFPRKIGMETARTWLHEMGFEVLTPRKGIFIDGHEREDVVSYRKIFLRRMLKIGFLHFTNAPTETAQRAIPDDIEPPTLEQREKTVVFCHDESTFQSNEDQSLQWGLKGSKMMKPKSRGAGIMVSDFIDEHSGFLAYTDEEYERAKALNPSAKKYGRAFLEYGENKEGYWTRDKFMEQIKRVVDMAELKYPPQDGWRHAWVFDHSSCHAAMADDALDANKMNVNPGGKQRKMRDTVWQGKAQTMCFRLGIPKGMRQVLQERGIDTSRMGADQMRKTLADMEDFKNEKSLVEHYLTGKGHIVVFLPKFHPELNPIERVWAQLKRYTKSHCKYSIQSLRKNIPEAYDSVTLENIQNHFRKVKHYMFGYLEGLKPGNELEETLKKYKMAVKSHRRIGINE